MAKTLEVLKCKKGFEYQGPRFRRLGDNSGEEFREDFLIPWLNSLLDNESGIVDFAGTKVYMSSFLEESFGGAVRKGYGSKIDKLEFINIEEDSLNDLQQYINAAIKDSKKR
jgi:hypothetical protein